MTTIRTTCPRCGEVDMGPESILLSVRSNGREGSYRFTCPECEDAVEKRADRKIVALLVSAGVDIDRDGETAQMHPELFDVETAEPKGPGPDAPTFTPDDVIEFHYMLEDDAYIREFFAKRG
ncbi:MAG TPA: hypothetical protein VGQ50_14420 [Actinomycetota bacterium]|jgi:predicted RNA-binding Zn-ribbon protein involved in translation (DUF1610 family)|nr:hypothetical protein [Actinomycetota bacterium]